MPQKHSPLSSSKIRRRKSGKKARQDGDVLEPSVTRLQHQVGNRAIQRAMAQREEAGRPAFNPLDPKVMSDAAQAVITANEKPIRDWLAMNTDRLRLFTIHELVFQVRRNVSQAGRLGNGEIQNLIQEWATIHDVNLPPISVMGTGSNAPSIEIPDAVKKAFSIAIDGVDVVRLPSGRLNISAKGATAKLRRGDIALSWGGSLGIDIPMEGFQLAGKLDKNRWELTLSTPGESSMPDLTKLAQVFQDAETAMRGMVEATSGFRNLDDVPKVTKAIKPHVEPVKKAVQALMDMAKSSAVSGGISIGGPTGDGESPDNSSPGGITLSATITIKF